MKNIIWAWIGLGFILNSCKKTPDQPPLGNENVKSYSVAELRAIASGTASKRFTSDVYFTGVVIADHTSGNFYKELYVRDRYNTGAIRLDLKSSSYYVFVGDSVRLKLNGYDVGYNSTTDMLEIDSVDNEKHLRKFASGAVPPPIKINLSASTYTNYLCELVEIKNVSFSNYDKNQVWADAIAQKSLNRVVKDCSGFGDSILVRTSNYASFASQKTPTGNGSIIGIATAYQGDIQMAIRNPAEFSMNSSTCANSYYLVKDFNDNSMSSPASAPWTQQAVLDPLVNWSIATFSGATFAKISGFYSSTNHNSETWLISPSVNLSTSTNPVLSFQTMANYSGNTLEVLVSTNYTGGAPSTATWTNLSGFALSTTGWVLTPSGNISLSGYKTANTRIAFKYTSTTSASKTYELDDIFIKEN